MNLKNFFSRFSLLSFVMLFFAGITNAFGITMFLAPVNLYDSGLSGTSMLLWELTSDNLSLGFFLIVLNTPFFIFGLKKQGIVFTVYSIFTVIIYAVSSFIFTDILPIDVTTSSPFAGKDLVLCAVFGGLISGIGSGTTIRFGGAIDGVEVIAVIFAKKLGLTVGSFVMIYNVILYIIVGITMQSWILPLYSIITYAVGVKTIDFIVEGLDKAKSAMIITSQPNIITANLSEAFGKGITTIKARGYYSDENKTLIYFVINRFQISKLKRIVRQSDKQAFVTITEVSDVLGTSLK
ncbi:MAG: YitT family protein [Acutalibacteraceae bacterium]